MQIAVPLEELGASQSLAIEEVYRYLSSNKAMRTVGEWASMGLPRNGFFGQGKGSYDVAMIPFTAGFAGRGTRIRLTMDIYVSNPGNRAFRWAISSRSDPGPYLGTGPTKDPGCLGQGVFTPQAANWTSITQTLDFRAGGYLPQRFYIWIWRSSDDYGNCHIGGYPRIDVYTESDVGKFRQPAAYVRTENGWSAAQVYFRYRDPDTGERSWILTT